jgi:purine-binding chemotaxis protein CheW
MQDIIQDHYQAGTGKENRTTMLVTFMIKNELFGIDVMKVHEIIGIVNITPIPDAVEYLRGVINLRGRVVPVIDIRSRFRIEQVEYNQNTVILIVDIKNKSIGLIVDAVSDVINISRDMINDYSDFDSGIRSNMIQSIVNYNDSLILILNTERILDDEVLSIIQEDTVN